ncbi:hypothetical protein B0A52_08187 [Exophiala mesophila]|uniref:FAD synthase n=1 Tax=Exophiala mesophila TaxID=212818 RepID=A0A438MV81_EXOME|nr:hypothetical protein B0A52_08187 [Exophiala mesophila]
MTKSTSLPPNAPTTNGTVPSVTGPGEVDVIPVSQSSPLSPSIGVLSSSSHTLQDVCASLHAQVTAFLSSPPPDDITRTTQEQTRVAWQVIEEALDRYSFQHVSLSYNGGKDCLVLLIIYLAVLHSHYTRPSSSPQTNKSDSFPQTIPSIYAKPPDPFPSVSSFVDYSSRLYHLDLTHISTNPGPHKKHRSHSNPPLTTPPPKLDPSTTTSHEIPSPTQSKPTISFRDAFALYLDSHPSVRAIFVGTRRTDPHGGHLTHFDPTDHNWPSFMRIHPVIDWHLSEIWCFLRSPYLRDLEDGSPLKYCAMYDQGYTSLGGVNDTLRNPELKYIDANGSEKYRPAHEMTWDEGERLGRE